jgi:nucleotide-binding universal stress UspA family protein
MAASKTPSTHLVVVGIDGSAGSDDALRWAIEEAKIRQATLRVVYAWGYPYVPGPEGAGIYLDPIALGQEAEARMAETLERVIPDATTRAAVDRVVVDGGGAEALITQSKAADLVVVGARGHGGFLGLLLGSVSNQVVHHAHCPVVVVPRVESSDRTAKA